MKAPISLTLPPGAPAAVSKTRRHAAGRLGGPINATVKNGDNVSVSKPPLSSVLCRVMGTFSSVTLLQMLTVLLFRLTRSELCSVIYC